MNLSITTDYLAGTGSPEKYLQYAAEAGFTHLHWCHQWNTDFLYGYPELNEIRKWLKEYQLEILDIHGSAGQEKQWFAQEEYRRKAGVELVANRIRMMEFLEVKGGLIMHIPAFRTDYNSEQRANAEMGGIAVRKSLDELMPLLEKTGVKIAVENTGNDSYELINALLQEYPASCLGTTYDSGHGNFGECKGLDNLEKVKDRLYVLHLNDNSGTGDPHQPPFMGTVDWERLAKIILDSPCKEKPYSFEIVMRNTPFFEAEAKEQKEENIRAFLKDAYERCTKFHLLAETCRKS